MWFRNIWHLPYSAGDTSNFSHTFQFSLLLTYMNTDILQIVTIGRFINTLIVTFIAWLSRTGWTATNVGCIDSWYQIVGSENRTPRVQHQKSPKKTIAIFRCSNISNTSLLVGKVKSYHFDSHESQCLVRVTNAIILRKLFDADGCWHVCMCACVHVRGCRYLHVVRIAWVEVFWMCELLSPVLWIQTTTRSANMVNLGITVRRWACYSSPFLPDGWSLSSARDCWDGLFATMHFTYLLCLVFKTSIT